MPKDDRAAKLLGQLRQFSIGRVWLRQCRIEVRHRLRREFVKLIDRELRVVEGCAVAYADPELSHSLGGRLPLRTSL